MLWLYHRSITLLNLLYASNLWIFVNVNTSTWYWNAKRYTSTLLYVWFSLNWRNAFIKIILFRVLCIVSFFIIEAFPNTPNLNVAKSQSTFCQATLDWQVFLQKCQFHKHLRIFTKETKSYNDTITRTSNNFKRRRNKGLKVMSEQRAESELCLYSHIHWEPSSHSIFLKSFR